MRNLAETLAVDEQMIMAASNPYTVEQKAQYEAWNYIYSWGWIRHKFYVANKLRESLTRRGFTEWEMTQIFNDVFRDVPEMTNTEDINTADDNSIPDKQ
jgi:hypothetical protein